MGQDEAQSSDGTENARGGVAKVVCASSFENPTMELCVAEGQDGSLEVWVTIDGRRTELDTGGRELLAMLEECMDGRALPEFCTLMVANPDVQLRIR